jgi:homoserine O-acetyltransferase
MTLGTPARDAAGEIVNAVLILHGTGGSGAQFLRPQFADELFGPGQVLDATKYFIIMPDDIGHGASSKPSDGLRAHFPRYDYADMAEAEHALVTEGLGVKRLRLLFGTSMGCMHAFLWGETWPDAASALMPMACLPTAIVGRNRLWRAMLIDAIKADPAWRGGRSFDHRRQRAPADAKGVANPPGCYGLSGRSHRPGPRGPGRQRPHLSGGRLPGL